MLNRKNCIFVSVLRSTSLKYTENSMMQPWFKCSSNLSLFYGEIGIIRSLNHNLTRMCVQALFLLDLLSDFFFI